MQNLNYSNKFLLLDVIFLSCPSSQIMLRLLQITFLNDSLFYQFEIHQNCILTNKDNSHNYGKNIKKLVGVLVF